MPLSQVYILTPGANAETTILLLDEVFKIEALVINTYHFRFLDGRVGRPMLLKQCAAVAKQARVYQCSWSTEIFDPAALAAVIEKDMVGL